MVRQWIFGLLLAGSLAGCRVCENPYDYCGPVVDSGLHPAGYRAGSEISTVPTGPEAIPSPPTPPPNDGDVQPYDDAPPTMSGAETSSVMRSRLRHAR